MANKILTPITLWSDFNDSLPIQCTVLEEREEDGVLLRKLRCFGRDVGGVRVNIFAVYCAPAGETAPPALLILPDASQTADVAFAERFAKKGYAVLMPDYRGEWENCEEYTIYPEAIPYANYRSAAGVWILQTIPPKKRAGTSGSPSRATAACTCVPLRPRGRSG